MINIMFQMDEILHTEMRMLILKRKITIKEYVNELIKRDIDAKSLFKKASGKDALCDSANEA